jgi:hypothetical protein
MKPPTITYNYGVMTTMATLQDQINHMECFDVLIKFKNRASSTVTVHDLPPSQLDIYVSPSHHLHRSSHHFIRSLK